ncbi:MAG: hypothetical protein ABH836_05210 [Candidatus Omnitrophota bacterium]
MAREITEYIERYFKYIESVKNAIEDLSSSNYIPHLKYLTGIALLDTMAKCVIKPNPKNNYERFTNFIKTFCDWDTCIKISLPHLVRFLRVFPSQDFKNLRNLAYSTLAEWKQENIYYLDKDFSYEEILDLWPKDKEHGEPIEKKSLNSLTHLSLLWSFRNSIVHELQIPGYGSIVLISRSTEAGYHFQNKLSGGTWELVYPVPFIMKLIDNGTKNLKQYCINNSLNPYDCYKFGSYWIDALN